MNDNGPLPTPPGNMMQRVAGHKDPERFLRDGRQTLAEVAGALSDVGRPIEGFQSICDFGCGWGRVLLAITMLDLPASIVGVDQDAEAVEWVARTLPQVEAVRGTMRPPLPFSDGQFDLIYSHSVFTHLDEDLQDQWFNELERLLRPNGMLVTTVHGDSILGAVLRDRPEQADELRERRERDGIVFIADDVPVDGMPDYYHTTLHAPWYVMHHWGQWFDILLYRERGALAFQDLVVMRKRLPDATNISSGRRRGRVRLEAVHASELVR